MGTFFVKLGKNRSIMGALYKGFFVTGALSLILLWPLTNSLIGMETIVETSFIKFSGMDMFLCGVSGLAVTTLIIVITEYTGTNYRPVKSVAAASVTGHGTNVIQGLAIHSKQQLCPQ